MRKFLATLAIVALAGAGVAACGGDDDDDGAAGTDTTVQDDNDTGSDGGNDDGGGGDDGGDDGGGDGDFQELLAQQSEANIKITYEVTSSGSDTQTITIAQDGEGRSAYIADNSSYITTDEGTVACDNLDAEPTCTEIPGAGAAANPGLNIFSSIAQGLAGADFSGVDTSDDEIAGRDATCVDYDYSKLGGLIGDIADEDIPENTKVRICADKETGFLLEYSGESGSDFGSYKATEVSEPDDSDFEPPVTPVTIPDIGN
jgi:hypothetical protein